MKFPVSIIVLLVIITICCLGCEKWADVPPDYSNKKIVVNSVFTHGQQLDLEVFSSKTVGEDFKVLNDLNLELFSHQNNIQANITYDHPTILTDFYPDTSYAGYYHLRAVAEGYDTVYAFTKVPKQIEAFANIISRQLIYDTDVFKINLNIIDEPGDDYYMMDCRIREEYKNGTVQIFDKREIFTSDQRSDNQVYSQTKLNNYQNVYLSDQNVDSPSSLINTEIYLETSLGYIDTSTVSAVYTELKVRRVEKDLYLHALNTDQYFEQLQSGADFEQQYINIHSNITGGLGIFAGYSEQIFDFQTYP